jgi:uncharacterized membrane protein
MFRNAILWLTALLLASAPLALAQGTYTQIDYPGATTTSCFGIDSAGDVVGSYVDVDGVTHGFLLMGGVFNTIDYPGATGTQAVGINDNGEVVGNFDADSFVFDISTQIFSPPIVYPDAVLTSATGINDAGSIVGEFIVVQKGNYNQYGFELSGTAYSRIAPPGTNHSVVSGITSSGWIVGFTENPTVNFSFSQLEYRRITIPNTTSPTVFGVAPSMNAVVGGMTASTGSVGFVYQNHVAQALVFPASLATVAYGINDSGVVSGYFYDSTRIVHGFTWTPPAAASEKK